MSLPDFVRVRDKRTGHHYSTRHPHPVHHEVIDRPAVDVNGRALPAKHHVDVAGGSRYQRMRKADLEAEVARRNETRGIDAVLAVGGNGTVTDLIAALEADDAANDGA